jgi:hypothetical protein
MAAVKTVVEVTNPTQARLREGIGEAVSVEVVMEKFSVSDPATTTKLGPCRSRDMASVFCPAQLLVTDTAPEPPSLSRGRRRHVLLLADARSLEYLQTIDIPRVFC